MQRCAKKLHNALWVYKYEYADENWQLKSGGEIDTAGTCALTATTSCDYAMTYPYVYEREKDPNTVAFSLPYYGNITSDNANATIIFDANGNQPTYNRETMGTKLWVEPLSGKALKAQLDVNRLLRLSKAVYNHPRHVRGHACAWMPHALFGP